VNPRMNGYPGLPVWPAAVERVHIIRSRSGNETKRSIVQVHGAPLDPSDVVLRSGVPTTSLARTVLDLARVDFYWKEQKTVGEFDGKIKYGRLLKPGQRIEDVIFNEKVREDAVRDVELQVVRWLWGDLYRRGVLRDRVLRAFARAS
jgi:hypothetical protein